MKENKYIGSKFDDFLEEEDLLIEVEARAIKRVISYYIQKEINEKKISKSTIAKRMNTSRSTVDRLLNPDNISVTLLTLENIAHALGKKLKIKFV
ncbi:MAG: XRE family transcriptional regulator [bacterium]